MPYQIAGQGDRLGVRLSGGMTCANLVHLGGTVRDLEDARLGTRDRVVDRTTVERFDVSLQDVFAPAVPRCERRFAHLSRTALPARSAGTGGGPPWR